MRTCVREWATGGEFEWVEDLTVTELVINADEVEIAEIPLIILVESGLLDRLRLDGIPLEYP